MVSVFPPLGSCQVLNRLPARSRRVLLEHSTRWIEHLHFDCKFQLAVEGELLTFSLYNLVSEFTFSSTTATSFITELRMRRRLSRPLRLPMTTEVVDEADVFCFPILVALL
jgi:hypothetical protein